MKIARIHADKTYIFCKPESLVEWVVLKLRKYKRHNTPIGDCYIKPKPEKHRVGY